MAFDVLRDRRFITEQDTNNEDEQPRYWECLQSCACHQMFILPQEGRSRHICLILDVGNRRIIEENEQIINPTLHKPLKRCPFHLDIEPEEPITEE